MGYFAAGREAGLLSEEVVRCYRASAPEVAEVFRRGGTADAEPAVPGWTFAVEGLWE